MRRRLGSSQTIMWSKANRIVRSSGAGDGNRTTSELGKLAFHLRDQEVGRSSALAPTILRESCALELIEPTRIRGGNKGALKIPSLSFQYLRRPGCAVQRPS
jgi:hypothetical protein